MNIIDEYGAILIYEKFRYLTIPNFIYSHFSFICNGFLNWGDGVYTIFTILCKQCSNSCTTIFKRIANRVDITIDCCFAAYVAKQPVRTL